MTRLSDRWVSASSSEMGLRANSWLMSVSRQRADRRGGRERTDVEAVGRVLRNEHEPAARIEGEADQIAAAITCCGGFADPSGSR